MGKSSIRSCIFCRRREEKSSLHRFVLADGAVVLDVKQSRPGRGVYVHPNAGCYSRMLEVRFWERAFRQVKGERWDESIRTCMEMVRALSGDDQKDDRSENGKKKPVRL